MTTPHHLDSLPTITPQALKLLSFTAITSIRTALPLGFRVVGTRHRAVDVLEALAFGREVVVAVVAWAVFIPGAARGLVVRSEESIQVGQRRVVVVAVRAMLVVGPTVAHAMLCCTRCASRGTARRAGERDVVDKIEMVVLQSQEPEDE